MESRLRITVAKDVDTNNAFSAKQLTLREKLLRHLLGDKRELMVIVPGNSVHEILINKR